MFFPPLIRGIIMFACFLSRNLELHSSRGLKTWHLTYSNGTDLCISHPHPHSQTDAIRTIPFILDAPYSLYKSTRHISSSMSYYSTHGLDLGGAANELQAFAPTPTSIHVFGLLGDVCLHKNDCTVSHSICWNRRCTCPPRQFVPSPDGRVCTFGIRTSVYTSIAIPFLVGGWGRTWGLGCTSTSNTSYLFHPRGKLRPSRQGSLICQSFYETVSHWKTLKISTYAKCRVESWKCSDIAITIATVHRIRRNDSLICILSFATQQRQGFEILHVVQN